MDGGCDVLRSSDWQTGRCLSCRCCLKMIAHAALFDDDDDGGDDTAREMGSITSYLTRCLAGMYTTRDINGPQDWKLPRWRCVLVTIFWAYFTYSYDYILRYYLIESTSKDKKSVCESVITSITFVRLIDRLP